MIFIKEEDFYKNAVLNIRRELKEYIENGGIQCLVMGISGGIDSALCAALAKPVCDELEIPLIGRAISISTNKEDEVDRGCRIGEHFCSDFRSVNLTSLYDAFVDELDDIDEPVANANAKDDSISLGNVKARMRMVFLYDIAGRRKGMVLSTDNFTELRLGFWTLHGDVGDYGMVQNLWKTEVYNMAEWIAKNELQGDENTPARVALTMCIDANATDGLGVSSTDLDQILPDWRDRYANTRQGYVEVDQILNGEVLNPTESQQLVLDRWKGTQFKRDNPYNIPRADMVRPN